jgi:3-oxoacyl-(acyl-carrier-protein) synthase
VLSDKAVTSLLILVALVITAGAVLAVFAAASGAVLSAVGAALTSLGAVVTGVALLRHRAKGR